MGIGIWSLLDPGTHEAFLGSFGYQIPSWMLIGGGALVMIVGFLGCCGAIRESRCLLGLVSGMLSVPYT